MISIRTNTFETNSSSTSSICIPKTCNEYIKSIYFGFDDFGWEFRTADPANYLYTAICYIFEDSEECNERSDRLNRLKEVLDKYDVEYEFQPIEKKQWYNSKHEYEDIGSIDHGYELYGMVEKLLSDEELLLRYLTLGEVYTGNDNGDSGDTWVDENGEEHPTCEYSWYRPDPDNYEYFYKGN